MSCSIVESVSPRSQCVNAPMSGTQKRMAWNWKVCTQQEETGDTIKYNVTWHAILHHSVLLLVDRVLHVSTHVHCTYLFMYYFLHGLDHYRLQVGSIELVGLHDCHLDCIVMRYRLLPKSTSDHKFACVRHWWVVQRLKVREENLHHVCILDPIICERVGK